MTDSEGFLLGRIAEAVDRIDARVEQHADELAKIQQILAEHAGERRAMKWFYSAGGAALTGLTAAAFKVAGIAHIVAGSGATK